LLAGILVPNIVKGIPLVALPLGNDDRVKGGAHFNSFKVLMHSAQAAY
jgi:hypothetical protein